jgi:type IV pilus assembly protein PilP
MIRIRAILGLCAVTVLTGCGAGIGEIQQWMRDTEKSLPRRIDPLPPVKPFEPFTYEGFDLLDPFKPRVLQVKPGAALALSPQLAASRRREPLEAFSLDQLKMVGTLQQGKENYALVRAGPTLFRVRKGNYMGQNVGLVTDINDGEIKLKEIVQDSAGDWSERITTIQLLEEGTKK